MKIISENFKILLKRIGMLMGIYFLCRLSFLLFNGSYFTSSGFAAICSSFFFGLRYDITAIVISNVLFIALHFFNLAFFYKRSFQGFLKTLFFIVNIPFLLLSCIDIGLFRFTGKRSGMELFSIMSFGNDFVDTLPKMITDFWYLLLLFFALTIYLFKKYPRLYSIRITTLSNGNMSVSGFIKQAFVFIIFFVLTFIGFRGGIQLKPLNILSASRYGVNRTTTLVLNTPFTVIKTFGKQTIVDIQWMSDQEARKITPIEKKPKPGSVFIPKNVVVIILESFGKEYIGSLNSGNGYTPFFDSLIGHSLVFPNAYANGKRSIEGIPAIIGGIPSLINDPFITSAYSGNSITTLPSLLKKKGYYSVFFHGGTDGTMGFDNFSKLASFDRYFGRTEYNDDNDYDGSWGIFDEPFLQRTAAEMNKITSPFLSVIFTLSSHHPYKIPAKFEKIFRAGTLPIHQSIAYADYSLLRFFETSSKMDWFRNTLFILTADHTALAEKDFYRNRVGLFSIPVIYYSPGDSLLTGKNMATTQQIDILPSVMDFLNYDESFFAIGNSVFDPSSQGYAINLVDGTYQLVSGDYSFVLDSINKNSLYKFTADSSLKNNLAGKEIQKEKEMELKLKSIVQDFNHALLHNEMK